MKHVIRICIVLMLTVSLVFSASFPKGIISFKNGTELKVKKVSIKDNFVFYKFKGENKSSMLEDIEYIKARGKVERVFGAIAGGATGLVIGGIAVMVTENNPTYAGKLAGITIGATAVTYLGGRLIGGIFDPWRKIYVTPASKE